MTKHKNIFLSIFIALTFITCSKKKLPAEASQDPVFYLKGDLDGQPITLEAGNENYVMNTTYYWDTTNVCLFKSELKKQACDTLCNAYTLTVILNDSKVSVPQSNVNLDNVLQVGKYAFYDTDFPSMYYRVNFIPKVVKSSSEIYNWTIENILESPRNINKYCPWVTLNAGQTYSVTLNFENSNSCQSTHQEVFRVGHNLQANINANRDYNVPGAVYDFSCQLTGTAPYQYYWDFGDGTSSTQANPNHNYQIMLNGRSRVALRVIDAKNDTCFSHYQVQISADPSCDANFTASFTPLPNTRAYSSITILLRDPSGHLYSTKNIAQPASSTFEITNINDYIKNAENHPTKRIVAKVNCVLSDGTKQIILSNAEISIALAFSN